VEGAAFALPIVSESFETTVSLLLTNQREKRMLLLVAKGKKGLCQTSRVISSRARSICSS